MSLIQQNNICYDTIRQTWSLISDSMHQKGTHLYYWGANHVRIALNVVHKQPPISSNQHINFSTLVQADHKNPRLCKYILGPLVGILTSSGKRGPFSGLKANFIDIIRTGHKKGALVFIFTPDHIDWTTQTIQGYVYDQLQHTWKVCPFPFPNVVYNRIPNRKDEIHPVMQNCLKRLQNIPHLTLFNPEFFNKQHIHRWLEQSKRIGSYLPQTNILQDPMSIKQLLKNWGQIYIKPTQGKAGSGIMKVVHIHSPHRYHLYFKHRGQHKIVHTRTLQSVWKIINQLTRHGTYLVQQGISLATLNNQPFDCRVLVQKNITGKWHITGIGVRVAGKNRITTHVPQGGQIALMEHAFKTAFDSDHFPIIQKNIKKLSLHIARTLEQHYEHLAEMSLDIGIDQHGQLWFFEANAKPMKFDEPDIRLKSLENLIEYCQFVTFNHLYKGEKNNELVEIK